MSDKYDDGGKSGGTSGYDPIVGLPGSPTIPLPPAPGSTSDFTISAVDETAKVATGRGQTHEFDLTFTAVDQAILRGGQWVPVTTAPFPFSHQVPLQQAIHVMANQQYVFSVQHNGNYPGNFPARIVFEYTLDENGNRESRTLTVTHG